MASFSRGIPRLFFLAIALTGFCLASPQVVSNGPNLCLWRTLFHLPACPACGSTRALAAFFHGQFAQALAYNRNVAITAPGLLLLLAQDVLHAFSRNKDKRKGVTHERT